ncbi:hypothetical protein [Aestuariivita boseongensis]|uniref:hypothetical protein n=1 Tax=Aestuariivita boseongensis TaxID=1470562 RepID=UPI000682D6EF|nr:hypothetical protein [Aestuariivita boseongensis]
MIRAFLKRGFRRFEKRYNYDVGYMHYVADASTSAGLRLAALPFYGQFSGPEQGQAVWAGASLGSTVEGDCGPCVQLVVDMCLEHGVPAGALAHCLAGRPEAAGDLGLGFRFAQAAIADDPALDSLRHEIETRFGKATLVAASFAASSGRVYPVLKRGLGFGQICSKVAVSDRMIEVQQP